MKLTKKLLPALGMLALSTCMMVTSTFAWFSMNEKVTATGMQVTAQGNQVYLQIINPAAATGSAEKSFVNGSAQTTATATTAKTPLLPVNVVKSVDTPVEKTGSDGTPLTDASGNKLYTYSCTPYDGTAAFQWVTSIGESTTVGTAATNYDEVLPAAINTYALKNTFQIRLDPSAGASVAAGALDVAGIDATITGTVASGADDSFKKCLSVLVVSRVYNEADITNYEDATAISSMGQVWEYNGSTFAQRTTGGGVATLSDGVFQAAKIAVVDIYVFFNGDSQYCTQAMLAAAAEYSYALSVQFSVAKQS